MKFLNEDIGPFIFMKMTTLLKSICGKGVYCDVFLRK